MKPKRVLYILFASLSLFISSCEKDEDVKPCEKWLVQEWVISGTDNKTVLVDVHSETRTLCGDDIKPTGTTYVYYTTPAPEYDKYYRKLITKK